MRDAVALQRYLHNYTEQGLPAPRFTRPHWHSVLVVPAYREHPALLERLARLPAGTGRTLVILVLNRPDSDPDMLANSALRDSLQHASLPRTTRDTVPVYCLDPQVDLYLHDMEMLRGPTPRAQGVGLARKAGCDLALQWMDAGGIGGQWLCSTDADATLPRGYFTRLESVAPDAVAAVFPFQHTAGTDEACNEATTLYELRLHHYVLGLEYAGSPYAFHTLGSCLAVRAPAYAHVRGFPRRAGAEDFYLLNKLAKLGPVSRLQGQTIALQSRFSARVPFGTGPAVAAIAAAEAPREAAVFYHPQCFSVLAALLATLPALADAPEHDIASLMIERGGQRGILTPALARQAAAALDRLGIAAARDHCRRQAKSGSQFQRYFHQWFDGLRTLQFIHALRDGGLPPRSLPELAPLAPQLWPTAAASPCDPAQIQAAVRQHWRWS